ncbi:hypothetical protein ACIQZD_01540 [Peribacillus sp. NPDC096447]|uniref:hypothetical protein n=1 Tax=Peribacillus sp. NPDC096447 TaxID=3364394 RepID=UPI0038014DEE
MKNFNWYEVNLVWKGIKNDGKPESGTEAVWRKKRWNGKGLPITLLNGDSAA